MEQRQIKFRAWHKKRKKMYEVLHLHMATVYECVWATVKGFCIIEQKDIHIQIQPKEIKVLQFTGLTDKNGKEIYEGDIVVTSYPLGIGAVVFSTPSFGVETGDGVCTDFDREDWERMEIIGNVFENPGLNPTSTKQ